MHKKKIAVFASGKGSNALNIIDHFSSHHLANVNLVISNREDAPVLKLSKSKGVKSIALDNETVANAQFLLDLCQEHAIDLIVLAGYLRKIPASFIHQFTDRVINIHPALLPKFGGQNMYGDKVHDAVLKSGERETGITIHYVNEHFDEGRIIAQFHCPVFENDTVDLIRERVQRLEHSYYPIVIEKVVLEL